MLKSFPVRAIRLLVLFGALTAAPAYAGPHIVDFALGISREETLLRAAEPCGDNLCGEVSFGGKNWKGNYLIKDDRLSAITLSGPLETAYVDAAFEGFKASPYVVYRADNEEHHFDFIEESRKGLSPAELDAAFAAFLKEMSAAGHHFASYLYTEPAMYEALKAAAATSADGEKSAPTRGASSKKGVTPQNPVGSCLSIDKDGVTIIIMPWGELQRSLAERVEAKKAMEAGGATKAPAGK